MLINCIRMGFAIGLLIIFRIDHVKINDKFTVIICETI